MAGDIFTQAAAGLGAIGALLLAASKVREGLRPEEKVPRQPSFEDLKGLEQRMDNMNDHLHSIDRALLRLELSVQNLQERRRT